MRLLVIILLIASLPCYSQIHIRMINGVGDTIVIPDPLPGNNAPIITSVGITPSVIRLPLDSATLIGHSTDYDGTVVLVHWAKVIGAGGTIVTPDDSTTKVRGLTPGTYRFSYQVTDDDGDIAVRYYEFSVLPEIIVTPPGTCFNFDTLTPSAPQTYVGLNNVVIKDKYFSGATSGNDVTIFSSTNVTFQNCYFSTSANHGISVQTSSNITIQDCFFANNGKSVIIYQCTGGVKVLRNQFLNVHRIPELNNFIQFNNCSGAGNEIIGNRIEAIPGETTVEDIVSVYGSTFPSGSPILIKHNYINGASTSTTGAGGFQLGDAGGSYIICDSNRVVNSYSFAASASGGTNITISNNNISMLADGRYVIGMYIANYAPGGGNGCNNITVTNNTVACNGCEVLNINNNPGYNCTNITQSNNVRVATNGLPLPTGTILDICPADYIRIRGEAHIYD